VARRTTRGIANMTILPRDLTQDISGFDIGPGNGLLDDWNHRHNGSDMDKDSDWAASGTVNETLLMQMLADSFLKLPPPKSTGRDHYNLDWVDALLSKLHYEVDPASVQATLLELTTQTIAEAVKRFAPATDEIYLCGGGAHNHRMVARIKELLPNLSIDDTGKLGVDPDAVEAVCFAWLAKQTMDHLPGNAPTVTGANESVILGGIYLC